MSLQAFPSITEDEFEAACKALEDRSFDKLDDTDWLSVRWSGKDLTIKQRKAIHSLEHKALDEDGEVDGLAEDSCPTDILLSKPLSESLIVDFFITLSPVYCVPVLYFSRQHTSNDSRLSLDQVYDWLIPWTSHTPLRNTGVMGGISMAHPVSDQPAFFIHPCNTPEALSALRPGANLTPEGYLILWLGLIGSSVGLHIPSELLA
ncbi:hypothetical protein LTR10_021630 [Elasticomyces elasticus]|uniref:Ubiquitin-like-conjugating enzyme ATG10 n=1 Tax=Exophiala sideris TaxID=1016849 RepID=A0ABR0J454_9EURO|nr:hypothetical protein LTR10_021630 [Elasticomyces elasticus]KAK5024126.1 hypothetical protein LTS07_008861 [Exophiala sideris]KAK5029014.1 hypothetical protein LTR13_008884 [Exophiala sideris]KAK5054838.1 hypothetical protein LTR69_008746 [Exophiala sideris]KAK5178837.1 hypothetical protein LTR44_008665 [Eurotiomycetes sp. CCFEE 6388]